jgi:SSS family solute:Na+ symporter
MVSSFIMYLAVKFSWISLSLLTLSNPSSDMAANFWRAWWAWLLCFIVTIIVSLFTKKKPKDELVGLVKGLTKENLYKEVSFFKRPEFVAVISLIVLILLNIYFW